MSPASTVVTSAATVWTARIFFAIATLFLLFDGVTKLFTPPAVVAAFTRLGIPLHVATAIGILELVCVALYIVPRTSVLGAILLAAYLGGAVAIHVRAGSTPFEIVFPVLIALLLWGALFLRDPRVRELIPLRSASAMTAGDSAGVARVHGVQPPG